MVPSHDRKFMSGWTYYSGKVTSQKISESEMGNRGSKSTYSRYVVKEQRVYGSCFDYIINILD